MRVNTENTTENTNNRYIAFLPGQHSLQLSILSKKIKILKKTHELIKKKWKTVVTNEDLNQISCIKLTRLIRIAFDPNVRVRLGLTLIPGFTKIGCWIATCSQKP